MSGVSELKEIFRASGRLSGVVPDYEERPEQLRMSRKIYQCLEQGTHLLVEAGTGTGKTLAYLAPAVLSGKKVVISTGTKALQEQLYYKDIPLIRKVLSRPFRVAYMKGRANYLCRTRFQEFRAFPLFEAPEQAKLFKTLSAWAETTRTGDVAELSDMGETSSLWRQVNAGTETCRGGRCPDLDACFITAMRREAVKADLLIVNHHLFFADLHVKEKGYGGVIPDYDAVIFDEAHMLEEVATHHFGVQVSTYRMAELSRDVRRGLREVQDAKKVKELNALCDDLDGKSRDLFSLFGAGSERERIVRDRLGPDFPTREAELFRTLNRLGRGLGQVSSEQEALAACARRAGEILDDLRLILSADNPDMVCWNELRGKGVFLHASPIDVSDDMRNKVFGALSCVVLTSATLRTGEDFGFARRRLGIDEAEEVSLTSPFDYRAQALLYLPALRSEPNAAGFVEEAAEEIRGILQHTRGRALILFTSNRHLQGVFERLDGTVDYHLMKQGDASRENLLTRFREDKASVLLATRSFWQGIDVQGDALSCVIIDKLPFASPAEPLVAARIEAIRNRGGNPFYEYQVPEAAISLKQGFGRLIRNKKDRGILSILDKRILSRPYGKFFIRSLPPCPVTRNAGEIDRIFLSEK